MRQKRAKSYKKQMNVYVHAFKFREPFQVIVDDQIVLVSQGASFNFVKGLRRTIQGEVKPMITQCCIASLYKTNNQEAIELAKTFERRRCNHNPKEPLTPKECLRSVLLPGNQHKYILATQNIELRNELRSVPGIPLVFMKNSVMIMDSVSSATTRYANALEAKKLTGGLNDINVGKVVKEEEEAAEKTEAPPKKKKKGPKGPNPLSVKRKLDHHDQPEQTDKKKRRRKHKRNDEKTSGDGQDADSSL